MPVVQAIVGHGNPAITRHYIHIGEESVKQAINALPQWKDAKTEQISDTKTEIIDLLDKATPKQLEKVLNYSQELLG